MSEARSNIGVLDVVAVAFCAIGVVAIWAFQLFAVPVYRAMFADFGSSTAAGARSSHGPCGTVHSPAKSARPRCCQRGRVVGELVSRVL